MATTTRTISAPLRDLAAESARAEQSGGRTQRQIRHSLGLLAGRFIALGLNLAVQVVTVRYLAKEDYGALAFALSMLSFGANVSLLGLDKTLSRFVAIHDERKELAELKGVLQVCFLGVVGSGLLAVVGGWGLVQLAAVEPMSSIALLLLAIALLPLQAIDNLLISVSAAFHATWAIFARRHLLAPTMKLVAVGTTVASAGSVRMLALCHVIAAAVGVVLFIAALYRFFSQKKWWSEFLQVRAKRRLGELTQFAAPNFLTDTVALMRLPLIVILLEVYYGGAAVADFRAVVPFARLNDIVLQSFVFLFIPTMSRFVATGDNRGVREMHWQSILWVSVLAFPLFVVTFSLGQPLATFMFGERYSGSGQVLSVLAVAYFIQAITGLHSRALRVHKKTRFIIVADGVAVTVAVASGLFLIPRYQAVGGALCLLGAVSVHALMNSLVMRRAIGVFPFERRYLRLYVSTASLAVVVWLCHYWRSSVWLTFAACTIGSLLLLLMHSREMAIEKTLPQLAKFPLTRILCVGSRRGGTE